MKIFKSILAAMLALTFMLSLVACGNGNNNTGTTAATKNEQTTVNSNTTATQANNKTTVAKKTDKLVVSTVSPLISRTKNKKGNASDSFVKSLKGYSLKVFYPWAPEAKGSVKELKESALASQKAVEKEFGVTVTEDGKFDNYNDNLTASLTTKSANCQIYMVQDFNYASYFKNNYMTDLTQAMSKAAVDFKDPWYNQQASSFFNVNYKQYAWIAYDAEYVFPYGIIYNKGLLKKAKLTDPETLATQGKWTWDTLIKYAKKLNTTNTIGFGTVSTSLMLESMVHQKGSSLVNVKKGASPTANLNNQTVKDCMSTLYKWCKNNEVCNTFSGKDWTYGKTQFAAGKVAMIFGTHDAIKSIGTNKNISDNFGVVQFPTPTATKTYTNMSVPQFAVFIPTQYKNDAAKILFLRNELYRQNYRYAQRNFTYQWRRYFSEKEVLDYACNMKYARGNNKTEFSWLDVCEDSSSKATITKVIDTALKSSGNSVETAIGTYKDAIDKAFKKIWDGYRITGKNL